MHVRERAGGVGLVVDHLDDVDAERGLHQVADLAGLHGERHLLEFGHHAAAAEVVEVAAVHVVGVVLGILLGQRGEVGVGRFDLLEDILRDRRHRLLVLAFELEQDVAGAHLRRGLVLLQVLLVERRNLGFGHGDRRAHLVDVDLRVLDLALLADAVLVLGLLEVGHQFRVGDGDLALEGLGRHGDDLELDLFVALLELGDHVGVAHRHPAGERGPQLLDLQRPAQAVFEFGGRERRVLNLQNLPVALFADELAILLEAG